ncbi:hypothetical protein ELE36_12330 [Pseudolysobacter antarcticus]|uniref:Uncharacterized protein n=1 Tax=Pseudolysobacter antarcticus TaxID=2511995 RepID=A0A411HKL8_9GAMM|nr:hypothetical protein [Pseudolysobacter antarcticus]QBB71076.1 hypothetical protein ELE36_12330 [Pseudolysobacter antarcticus]
MKPIAVTFILVALGACSSVNPPLQSIKAPLPQIAAAEYALDRETFLEMLRSIGGSNALDCGVFRPSVGNNSQGIPCIRKAWEEHRAFTIANEYREGYCPNLVGYAGDAKGRVYLVQSCPDRDHVNGKALSPSIFQCPQYLPPSTQFGDGQCSVLDSV